MAAMTEHYRNPVPTVDIIIEIDERDRRPGGPEHRPYK